MASQVAIAEELTGWPTKPLSDCIEKVKTPRKIPRKRFLESGSIPIISQEAEFINGYWDNDDDAISVEKPVVIFGDHTQVLKLVDFNFVVGADGVKVLRPKEFLSAKFLKYFLEANPIPSYGYARHFKLIKDLEVPLPAPAEQKRIVAVLDQAFAALDRAHDHTQTNIVNSVSLLESWLQSAFSLGEQSWPMRPLSQIAENLDRKRVPITKKDRQKGTIPYYGASGVVDYVADHLFDEDLLLVSEDGANLLARTYPIAFSISGKSWVNNHVHVLRFDDFDSQEFVRLYLNSISIAPFVSGMAQPKLNQKSLGQIEIPYPPLEERKRIVAAATAVSQRAQTSKRAYEQQLASATNLKKSLLERTFTGKLT